MVESAVRTLSPPATVPSRDTTDHPVKIAVEHLDFYYGAKRALEDITVHLRANVVSAFIGTFSHVLLDSVMHADVQPFWPVRVANGLLGVVSIRTLEWICIGAGVAGAVLYFALASRLPRHRSPQARRP